MIPIFTSHFSIGKSILTLDNPSKIKSGASDSVFSVAEDLGLQEIVLVENTMTGFLKAYNTAKELNKKIIFGLKINVRGAGESEEKNGEHKIVIFAKNGEGCKLLNKIYSQAFAVNEGWTNFEEIQNLWSEDCLKMAVPFYDSFIFKNTMTFSNCIPDFRFTAPTFFIERNNLPFDSLIEERIRDYSSSHGFPVELTKSILYKTKSDAEALQTYKCICGRSFQNKTLSKPNLDHFGSDEFCAEALAI
jgi:DNA polymerase III alpha subunit